MSKETSNNVGPFDFFIAHAGPDHRQAKRLYWFLREQGCEVFLDKKGLSAGSQWPTELGKALQASRATVVLISSNTDNAFYQHEEIARAIQRSRDDPNRHVVIPVIL